MKVNLSALGKFHFFDLARELNKQGYLQYLYSAYPKFKFRHENLPSNKLKTFPYIHATYMALPFGSYLNQSSTAKIEAFSNLSFAKWLGFSVAQCDVYVGLSGSSLYAGKKVQQMGGKYVCDRGSSHILEQQNLVQEEAEKLGVGQINITKSYIDVELKEYQQADLITLPSMFAYNSFIKYGVDKNKLRVIPYGVDLAKFYPTAHPNDQAFNVLFVGHVSMRKGVHYLLQAYNQLSHKNKTLTLIGSYSVEYISYLKKRNLLSGNVKILGPIKSNELKHYYSASHVLVLPSIEDGFGLVMAEAMACGCPVIATSHTGASDLYQNGREGYIVSAYDVDALTERMQNVADNPDLRNQMAQYAFETVTQKQGWGNYGVNVIKVLNELLS